MKVIRNECTWILLFLFYHRPAYFLSRCAFPLSLTSIPTAIMSKTISPSEVAAHSSAEKGMYIIVDDAVYDVTNFVGPLQFPIFYPLQLADAQICRRTSRRRKDPQARGGQRRDEAILEVP